MGDDRGRTKKKKKSSSSDEDDARGAKMRRKNDDIKAKSSKKALPTKSRRKSSASSSGSSSSGSSSSSSSSSDDDGDSSEGDSSSSSDEDDRKNKKKRKSTTRSGTKKKSKKKKSTRRGASKKKKKGTSSKRDKKKAKKNERDRGDDSEAEDGHDQNNSVPAGDELARLDQLARTYYLEIPNIKRLLHSLLTSSEDLEDQGYEPETVKILERISDDLKKLFKAIDQGQSVALSGIVSERKRKKLRHLFQALRMTQDATGSWEKSSLMSKDHPCGAGATAAGKKKTVSYWKDIVSTCVKVVVAPLRQEYAAKAAAKTAAFQRQVVNAFSSSSTSGAAVASSSTAATRLLGPVMGPGAKDDDLDLANRDPSTSAQGASSSKVVGAARPPPDMVISRRGPDAEAEGGNEDDFKYRSTWMTEVPDALAGMFGDKGVKKAKQDAFEVERTQGEIDAFEKAFASDRKSLFDQVREGEFGDEKAVLKRGRDVAEQRRQGEDEMYGASAKEQEAIAKRRDAEKKALEGNSLLGGVGDAGPSTKIRRMFDPSKDLDMGRKMDPKDFSKMMEDGGMLKGKFARSAVSSSFL
ncbi:unnamed protein product [Amoebophrya sp. A25]|nr:unnamed protein product [Amoebophrya sp. A25]|eukprot:GSA25T00007049001.1